MMEEGFSVEHGGGNVMDWGCFCGDKDGDLKMIKKTKKKKQSHGILSIMEWTAQSPHLILTELLWEQLSMFWNLFKVLYQNE